MFAAEPKSDRASRGASTAEKPRASSKQSSTRREKVDLNTADIATLESLPAIGPEIARNIIAARPFKSLDDLDRVKGIGPERLEEIRGEVTLSVPAIVTKQKLGEPALTPTGRGDATARLKPVNVNTASQPELEVLPGIGPVKAAAIIEARQERPFRKKEDLMRVTGIKEATFNEIKDLITVR